MEIKIIFQLVKRVKLYPKNIYGLSKKMNEEYVNLNYREKTKYIGLRFFHSFWTVG